MKGRLTLFASPASVLAAILGSWWWIAALAYALLGGGAGLAASLAAYRETLGPYRGFLTLAAIAFLAAAHYQYWVRRRGRGRRATKMVLWMSTAMTVSIVFTFYIWGTLLAF